MEPRRNLHERQEWDRPVEFLFAIVGYSVGIGNVWRFPYTCYESGGGAFLVAYLIMWTLCGVPLLFMELAIGQYARLGPIGAMAHICPLFKGAAAGCIVMTGINLTYYMVILVWSFYFLFNSFKQELPWSRCGNEWNTQYCFVPTNLSYEIEIENNRNKSALNFVMVNKTISASVEYFRGNVLQITSGIDNIGTIRWEFALILLMFWIIIYFGVFKGTKSVGKVVYFTVLFPYFVLIVLIIRGLTLPGSYEGIMFLFTPKWHTLAQPQTWIHAAATNFFSLGIGGGAAITLASFNKRKGKILGYTLIIAFVDLMTSLMAGVAVFSNLGYLAQIHGKQIKEIVDSGIELVFIVFPEIFTTMPLAQLFSVLFYLMFIMLLIDSVLVIPEICVTALTDRFKHLPRTEILYAIACILFYFLGCPTIAQGGMYYFALLEYYVNFVSSVSLLFFEIIAVSWIYGARRLAMNILEMTGSAPHLFIIICWYIISPLLIIAIWVFSFVKYSPFTYGSYVYPTWAVIVAWIIASLPLICIPIGMFHAFYKTPSITIMQRLRLTVTAIEFEHEEVPQNIPLKSTTLMIDTE